ncbi:MAG TPA: hypothetical protein VGB85_28680 [Nannocystis sp.]
MAGLEKTLTDRVLTYLAKHPNSTTPQIAKALKTTSQQASTRCTQLWESGRLSREARDGDLKGGRFTYSLGDEDAPKTVTRAAKKAKAAARTAAAPSPTPPGDKTPIPGEEKEEERQNEDHEAGDATAAYVAQGEFPGVGEIEPLAPRPGAALQGLVQALAAALADEIMSHLQSELNTRVAALYRDAAARPPQAERRLRSVTN